MKPKKPKAELEELIRQSLAGTPHADASFGITRGTPDGSNWSVFLMHEKATNPHLTAVEAAAAPIRAQYNCE